MRVVDLSRPIEAGMPVYPGDPEVAIAPALGVEADGVAVARLDLGTHTGTHLDAPSHSVRGGRTVDRIPLELLQGEAHVLRAAAGAGRAIGVADLPGGLPDRLPSIVCVATGWDRRFGSPDALRHPHLSLGLARELWARGARVLGVDTLSPDPTAHGAADPGAPPAGSAMPVHEFWLGADGVIVENLAGLTELPERAELVLLPLRLAGLDGSPIRAVARIP